MKWVICLLFCSRLCAMTNQEFASWWESYRSQPAVTPLLKEMEDYFVRSGALIYSSHFWNEYNKLNIEQLTEHGFAHFKQTVCKNYFTWNVTIDHPYARNLKRLVPRLDRLFDESELNRKHSFFTEEESRNYNLITLYFLHYMLDLGCGSYIARLEEPLLGDPPYNLYKGKRVSQDMLNSLLEYLSISRHCPMDEIANIIEIGAGSGRTAFCFLSLHPDKKYVIVDFPPALYISQTYLSTLFQERNVFSFRPFENFEEIAEEYAKADLVFLTPDQLEKIPDRQGGLFLAIDCLHEMKAERVVYYFREAERVCSYLYYKCWKKTYVAPDHVHHIEGHYPVHPGWQLIFQQPCIIPDDFFHALYKMTS